MIASTAAGKMILDFDAKRARRIVYCERSERAFKPLVHRRERRVNKQALHELAEEYEPIRIQRTGWDVA